MERGGQANGHVGVSQFQAGEVELWVALALVGLVFCSPCREAGPGGAQGCGLALHTFKE